MKVCNSIALSLCTVAVVAAPVEKRMLDLGANSISLDLKQLLSLGGGNGPDGADGSDDNALLDLDGTIGSLDSTLNVLGLVKVNLSALKDKQNKGN